MAQMRIADVANDFGADHVMRAIDALAHVFLIDRLEIAGPAAAGIELGIRFEQRRAATDAGVSACLLEMGVFTGSRPLGRGLAGDFVLDRAELRPPLVIALDHFRHALSLPISAATDTGQRPLVSLKGQVRGFLKLSSNNNTTPQLMAESATLNAGQYQSW